MEKIKVGKIINVVGLKGELKVYHYSDYKERFEELSKVYIENMEYKITGVRYMKEIVILKLKGVNERTEAEKLKGKEIFFNKDEARILPEGSFYITEIIGLNVEDEKGNRIGIVSDVIQNTSQDLYEIEKEDKSKFLIPAVEEFILNIDLTTMTMRVKLIEGLLEL